MKCQPHLSSELLPQARDSGSSLWPKTIFRILNMFLCTAQLNGSRKQKEMLYEGDKGVFLPRWEAVAVREGSGRWWLTAMLSRTLLRPRGRQKQSQTGFKGHY